MGAYERKDVTEQIERERCCARCAPTDYANIELDERVRELRAENAELRKDKERLDWFDKNPGCEPMRSVRYDGEWAWRNMGVWYDSLREAIDAATKG